MTLADIIIITKVVPPEVYVTLADFGPLVFMPSIQGLLNILTLSVLDMCHAH